MTTVVIYDIREEGTDATPKYFNKPGLRASLIRKELESASSESTLIPMIPNSEVLSRAQLRELNIHSEDYLDFLENAYSSAVTSGDNDWFKDDVLIPNHFSRHGRIRQVNRLPYYKQAGYYGNDTMTPIGETTWTHAIRSARNSYRAADILLDWNAGTVYALNSSPGHHAPRSGYAGYCFINNGAVVASRLAQRTHKRVAILDLDYHAGDGTQDIFYDRSDVLTISIHADPSLEYPTYTSFPGEIGEGEGEGYNYNICLGKGTQWEEYSTALDDALATIRDCKCSYLVVAFGADTYKGDPDPSNKAGFALEIEDYAQMGNRIRSLGLPTVVTQEGGYSLEAVPTIAQKFLGL